MPKTRPSYPIAFREQIVALWRSGRSVTDLASEFEPCVATIQTWVRQAERDAGRRADVLSSAERDELQRLRRENKRLKEERDILSKGEPCPAIGSRGMGNAWFAQNDATSSRSSSS